MPGRGSSGGGRGGGSRASIRRSNNALWMQEQQQQQQDDHRQLTTTTTTTLYDITHPELFPDFLWHSSGRVRTLSESESAIVGKEAAAAAAGVAAVKDEPVDPDVIVLQAETEPPQADVPVSSSTINTSIAVPLQIIPRSAMITYTIQKQQDIQQALQQSVTTTSSVSAASASEGSRAPPLDQVVLENMGPQLSRDTRYFPAELLFGTTKRRKSNVQQQPAVRATATHRESMGETTTTTVLPDAVVSSSSSISIKLETLEDNFKTQPQPRQDDVVNDEFDDDAADEQEEEEEEEDEMDYTQDYYASEDDSDVGGDGEATF